MLKIYPFLLLFFLLYACQSNSKETNNKVLENQNPLSQPNAEVKRYVGLLSMGSAGAYFRPCINAQTLWAVVDSSGQAIAAQHKKVYQYGYDNQSVMAFVDGSLLGKAQNADSSVSNILKINKLDKLAQKDWDGYCLGFEFVIFGSKPFWAVEISPKEQYIDFNDEPNLKYHHFKYVQPVINGDVRTYETESFDGTEKLKVVISKGSCKDDSNPKPYPFSAQVILNGKIYNGCAQW